jgi:Ca2+-binding RTX toxin-like protein
MSSVTITGTSSSTLVLHYDAASNYALAAQLASQINAGVAAGTPTYVTTPVPGFGQTPPALTAGQTGVFFQTDPTSYAHLAGAYTEVAANTGGTAFITAANGLAGQVILSDKTTNLDFNETGGSGTVAAGGGNNTLNLQGAGNWLVNAGGGANGILLGSGNDLIQSIGNDSIYGGTGAETVNALGATSDFVQGGSSDLYFVGGAGGATIYGGNGSDTFFGGSGTQLVYGGSAGDNFLEAGFGAAATLQGGGAGDTLAAVGSSAQVLTAGPGSELLTAALSSGADLLTAGYGNDTLVGGSGADTFVGGAGNATIQAGSGSSVFELVQGQSSQEVVQGIFNVNQIKINLVGYSGNPNGIPADVTGNSVVNGSLVVTLSDNTKITFLNINHTLTANNFTH